jgi:rsbT co-antagonist protein RsbR
MNITQRQVTIALFSLLAVGTLAIALSAFSAQNWNQGFTGLAAAVLFSILLGFYWRGVEQIRYVGIIVVTLFAGFGSSQETVEGLPSLSNAIPPIVALLLGGPYWIAGSMAAVYFILLVRGQFLEKYAEPQWIAIAIIVGGGLVLSRLITDSALHRAEANAERAEKSLAKAEQQASELAKQAEELRATNDQQSRLIDLVATLETPAVSLAQGVLLAPIVGHLDSRRAQNLTSRILQAVSEQRTKMVILDIAGVTTVDTQVAHALLQATQAIRLLGCSVTITGISASVATTITHLGISLEGVTTARTPQDALANTINTHSKNGKTGVVEN